MRYLFGNIVAIKRHLKKHGGSETIHQSEWDSFVRKHWTKNKKHSHNGVFSTQFYHSRCSFFLLPVCGCKWFSIYTYERTYIIFTTINYTRARYTRHTLQSTNNREIRTIKKNIMHSLIVFRHENLLFCWKYDNAP